MSNFCTYYAIQYTLIINVLRKNRKKICLIKRSFDHFSLEKSNFFRIIMEENDSRYYLYIEMSSEEEVCVCEMIKNIVVVGRKNKENAEKYKKYGYKFVRYK